MLKLENITKYYYSSSSVTCALRKINLEFKVGEFVAITGESGSGKTTLLNIISGFDSYEDGELYIDNKTTSYFDNSDWEEYRKNEISFIFQNYNIIESFTALENVAITYIIEGYSYKEAKLKAKEQLLVVGLENEINKKAAKLSGGQKQRLSIARALAKETNIIVADEPTGNLDEENGTKIFEILKRVSKDKLVIVVTHNIGQIEPFITRKIRIHDGEVVANEFIENVDIDKKIIKKEQKDNNSRKVFNFAFLNIISKPVKSTLMLLLILLCSLSTFIFYGNFKMNLDDNKTKILDSEIFINHDDTRLLVKKNDSSVITDDILKSALVDKVVSVEKYDYITDINYYRPGDYKFVIDSELTDPMNGTMTDYSYYSLIDNNHFMRSAASLSEDMLEAGRLPQNDFEMVIYSDDLSLLNTKEIVLFHNEKTMGKNVHFKYDVEIVGILKEKTDQVYFSEIICQIMDMTQYDYLIYVNFQKETASQIVSRMLTTSILVVDPKLENKQFSVGKKNVEYMNFKKQEGSNFIFSCSGLKMTYNLTFDKNYLMDISDSAIGVSKDVFLELYDNYKQKTQFAIFIEDYANTREVINDLFNKDLNSISCFQSSVLGYDTNKLIDRYTNLGVSLVSLILINLIVIILVISIMKLKRNDYLIFKFNGLTNRLCNKINYFEINFYAIMSLIILFILSTIVKNFANIKLLVEMYKYIKFYDYIIVSIVILVSMNIIGKKFNDYLSKFTKIISMRED